MLSLIRATSRHTPSLQRLCSIHPINASALNRRMLVCKGPRDSRSRALHHTPRAASSAEGSSPDSSASSSPSPSGESSAPAKDTPSSTPDSNSKSSNSNSNNDRNSSTIETPSVSTSRQSTSTSSSTKRRAKSSRGANKTTDKTHLTTDPVSRVYVPSIPQSFLETNYYPVSSNTHDIAAIPYHIHKSVLDEVLNTVASCLLVPDGPQAHIQRMPARHNNILISSPSQGSSRMLETITMATAKKIGADLIVIDMQDLMELTTEIFNSKGTGNPWPVDHLSRGFNPFVSAPVPLEYMEDMIDESDDDFDDDTDDGDDDDNDRDRAAVMVDSRFFTPKRDGRNGFASASSSLSLKEKFERFWTALLLAEPMPSTSSTGSSHLPAREKSLPKVLYLKDIANVILTPFGAMLLPSLTSAVLTLRKAGHNVMFVAGHSPSLHSVRSQYEDETMDENKGSAGTTNMDTEASSNTPLTTILQKLRSPHDQDHPLNNLAYGHISLASLTYDSFPGATQSLHHISIPPFLPPSGALSAGVSNPVDQEMQSRYAQENAQLLRQDKADRIRQINCRNLHAVLHFRGGHLADSDSPSSIFGSLKGVDSEVWGYGRVFRIISNALGSLYLDEKEQRGSVARRGVISNSHVENALETYSQNVKLRKLISSDLNAKTKPLKPQFRIEECDRYERKLLGSIVDPDKIKTTFKNTIIPSETIQTLQTMITLPLVRPQFFSYGLLRDEFISGLLLFGPPGTGKTLLAKAVAKESGAKMLEIKASDIFDMYVGEGEKNVSAVFSLARKLSPCVIFLDEVDSIFRARGSSGGGGAGGGGGNSSQREILNQFMVEWDGLRSSGQNQGIVVMASTNRPFELDDAVLRRLPRRILVDLPSEEAREQILRVYLGQEQLEEGVDIKELAKKTAFFSGSDLKNLCVSAALASVRENVQNELRDLHSVEKPLTEENAVPKDSKDK
ncbi:hypothetical protein BC939DRAFT_486261, partial [Gamsiella multidivaricata]|uniref:uncharacterized protein n=1 Tax=Gamsiella multidivaricata TaxID=101098 RepID=UPI00221E80C5